MKLTNDQLNNLPSLKTCKLPESYKRHYVHMKLTVGFFDQEDINYLKQIRFWGER